MRESLALVFRLSSRVRPRSFALPKPLRERRARRPGLAVATLRPAACAGAERVGAVGVGRADVLDEAVVARELANGELLAAFETAGLTYAAVAALRARERRREGQRAGRR